jgi:phage baseplate assembly protein W
VGAKGRDLVMVEGLDALGQSLTLALTTRLGDDIFNTAFGFDGLNALVDEQNPILQRERIRIAVIQVLRKDPRVRRILDVKLDEGQLDLPAVGRDRRLTVRVDFEAVSGDQVTADLGRVPTNA